MCWDLLLLLLFFGKGGERIEGGGGLSVMNVCWIIPKFACQDDVVFVFCHSHLHFQVGTFPKKDCCAVHTSYPAE